MRSSGVRLANGLVRRRLFDRRGSLAGRLRFKSGSCDASAWSRRFSSASSTKSCERLRLGLYASRHVQVLISHRTGSSGPEEEGHTIRGDKRLRVVLRAVHPGAEIHRRATLVGARATPSETPGTFT